ncbi:MAG: serine hydrolase [Vulcanimicrobiaceae bacterium]
MTYRRRGLILGLLAFALAFAPLPSRATSLESESPLDGLQAQLSLAANRVSGRVGVAIEDLATGMTSGVNASASLPAASTIKIPVMVEVFKQMEAGTIALDSIVHLESRDRDRGWGDLASARLGTPKSIKALLWAMITESDNTATNMLIRMVGRTHINATMLDLGLERTHLTDDIRTETDAIRYALRTSPRDMVSLLDAIARDRLVDSWSSRQMLAILTGQTHNSLLPGPLPKDVRVAHKTGTLHDTLNDVGIVYNGDEPYIIAVMTTELPSLAVGRSFIHKVSRIAYDELGRFAAWREGRGIAAFSVDAPAAAVPQAATTAPIPDTPTPDETMWNAAPAEAAAPPAR